MILIVASQFDKSPSLTVIQRLITGSQTVLDEAGVAHELVSVPGAVEIPVAIQHTLAQARGEYDAVIALGCVIKGETDHYEYVLRSCTDGLTRLSLDHSIPVIQGVLACHTAQHAEDRAHLGREYAQTALTMRKLFAD